MTEVDLSILIASTHTRWSTFGQAIQTQVWEQYEALPQDYQDRIEILMHTDNKKQMLGFKRNVMVDAAQGKFVQFIDDDDRIEPDMFRSVLDAITDSDADVITFLVSVSLNGDPAKICRYSKDFTADRNTETGYERLPNHICAVKRELALKASFPNVAHGEDSAYSKLLLPHLGTEHFIDRVLYHYDYSSETTETQQHLRAPLRRRRRRDPLVDVVMLSNATTPALRDMTQNAIDTCISGANSLPVNVIVMEQQPVTYRYATTVRTPRQFHYNAFANSGARQGSAEWIMVANNDLIFGDGWLHNLLAANHPVVSPKCPRDRRQAEFTENTTGYFTARHLSGWCFMIQRKIWEQIGGFDECVSFWASDDVVIEQCRALGIAPMLVPSSTVEHLGSVTLKEAPDHDDLTWAQLDAFNDKYGPHRLSTDPRFLRWKANQPVGVR